MLSRQGGNSGEGMNGLSPTSKAVWDYLKARGASFFVDIVRGTRKLKSEVEGALWELVAAGLSRPTALTICAPSSTRGDAPARAAAAIHVRGTARGAGPCSFQARRRTGTK